MIVLAHKNRGFTLIELMVSVSIFVLVMVISMGAILSILDANQKSETQRAVVDNLNSTLESMTRSIRFGTNYHAYPPGDGGDFTQPRDTHEGDDTTTITVLDSDGNEVTYSLASGQIMRSINGAPALALTSPDVDIENLSFRVFGSLPYIDAGQGADMYQPIVIIVIKGLVVGNRSSSSAFTLETTVSERSFDNL